MESILRMEASPMETLGLVPLNSWGFETVPGPYRWCRTVGWRCVLGVLSSGTTAASALIRGFGCTAVFSHSVKVALPQKRCCCRVAFLGSVTAACLAWTHFCLSPESWPGWRKVLLSSRLPRRCSGAKPPADLWPMCQDLPQHCPSCWKTPWPHCSNSRRAHMELSIFVRGHSLFEKLLSYRKIRAPVLPFSFRSLRLTWC